MGTKFAGGVKLDSTDVTIPLILRSQADNTGKTGLVAADLTCYYWREGDSAAVVISLSDLSALSDAHTNGGVFEVDATNMPGVYRLDLPDAVAASGEWMTISVTGDVVANIFEFVERFNLERQNVAGVTFTAGAVVSTGVNVQAIDDDDTAADLLGKFFGGGATFGIVDDAAFSPTVTQFEATNAAAGDLSTTADYFNNLALIWTSGPNQGIVVEITDFDGTNQRFTITTGHLIAAPTDTDEFLIIGRFS